MGIFSCIIFRWVLISESNNERMEFEFDSLGFDIYSNFHRLEFEFCDHEPCANYSHVISATNAVIILCISICRTFHDNLNHIQYMEYRLILIHLLLASWCDVFPSNTIRARIVKLHAQRKAGRQHELFHSRYCRRLQQTRRRVSIRHSNTTSVAPWTPQIPDSTLRCISFRACSCTIAHIRDVFRETLFPTLFSQPVVERDRRDTHSVIILHHMIRTRNCACFP